MSKHPCAGKCTDYKDEQCSHCPSCLSNFAKNDTQTDLCIKSDSQNSSKLSYSEFPNNSDFKMGDLVVPISGDNRVFEVVYYDLGFENLLCTKDKKDGLYAYPARWYRKATPEEIQAGHRIEIQSLGDDEYIENHVSPNCVRGGEV